MQDDKTNSREMFLDPYSENQDGFLDRIITGNETWFDHSEHESKQDCM